MSTFDALKTSVLDHQFSTTKYDTYVGEKLNEAQAYIAAQVNIRELFDTEAITTTAGTASSTLPADFLRIESLTETTTGNLNQLELIPVADYDLLDTTTRGRPTHYAVDRSNLKLYPTPDAAYSLQLRYYHVPETMSTGESPEIPATYHHLLESYALTKAFEREHQLDLAQYHWQRFQDDLAKARGELQADANDANQVTVVPGMWSDSDAVWPTTRIP